MGPSREETSTMLPKMPNIRTAPSPYPEPQPESTKSAKRRTRTWKMNIGLLSSILILALAGLIIAIVHYTRQHQGIIVPRAIGGRLSILQAKTIDFLCAALFAPLLMLVLDYVWFSNVRTSVLNEQKASKNSEEGVPLPTLVEASITSAGSFDLLKLRTLVRGRTWRLYMLGLLVLLSGTASKALANFIAYEAYDVQTERGQFARLMLLSNLYLNSPGFINGHDLQISDLPFSIPQKADLANQMTALLTGLRFESAVSKLDASGAYIGSNATQASLNALDRPIVGLTNVPGYRLTTNCEVSQPQSLMTVDAGTAFHITSLFPEIYQAVLPGVDTIANPSGYSEVNKYIAFSVNGSNAYLGNLDNRFSNSTMPSEFGEVPPKQFNMTLTQGSGFNHTNWGISCNINRQEGFLNYTRDISGSWKITATSFSPRKTVVAAPLKPWQFALDYHAPQSTISGIGPAIGATAGPDYVTDTNTRSQLVNWSTYALNYLYASGRAQQIALEVAASNATIGTSSSSIYHYTVDATTKDPKYRITYIPILLILGLVCAIAAAALAGGMVFYTRDTTSVQMARQVDALRLVVDSVSGLQEAAEEMAFAGGMKQDELEKWAARFKVRYSEVTEGGENGDGVVVRLARADM